MIQFLRVSDGRLVSAESAAQAQIIRLVAPEEAELKLANEISGAPMDFLTGAVDRDERPRIETEDGFNLMILRVPHEEKNSDVPVLTVAFGVILTPRHIVSVCSVESAAWDAMQTTKARVPSIDNRPAFLCTLFLNIARLYLYQLNRIRRAADNVEREIHYSMRNKMLIQMLNLEKCLVYFTTSLRSHEPLWDRFRKIHGRELSEDEMDMLEDVRIEFRQAQELADIHSNILTGMMDAFASVISNNLNVVLKFLTSVTIIFMIPTLVASVYGMNVDLPFQHSGHAFLITMGISLLLSIAGVIIFLSKKLF